jgi:dTDP-4-dehydrorhamnose 3,5-epimerase
MQVIETEIPEVKILVPRRFQDSRGVFSETYNKRSFEAADIRLDFIQDNWSLSVEPGVVRGLHYQIPPFAQDKLVRVLKGAVLDVAVDIRRHSPTFGKYVSVRLSEEEWNQLLVPVGFAHGFCTLAPHTEVAYKVTGYYSPEHERGIAWNDPDLGIAWPVSGDQALLSPKDAANPRLRDVQDLL